MEEGVFTFFFLSSFRFRWTRIRSTYSTLKCTDIKSGIADRKTTVIFFSSVFFLKLIWLGVAKSSFHHFSVKTPVRLVNFLRNSIAPAMSSRKNLSAFNGKKRSRAIDFLSVPCRNSRRRRRAYSKGRQVMQIASNQIRTNNNGISGCAISIRAGKPPQPHHLREAPTAEQISSSFCSFPIPAVSNLTSPRLSHSPRFHGKKLLTCIAFCRKKRN